jgi:hypothetical protein
LILFNFLCHGVKLFTSLCFCFVFIFFYSGGGSHEIAKHASLSKIIHSLCALNWANKVTAVWQLGAQLVEMFLWLVESKHNVESKTFFANNRKINQGKIQRNENSCLLQWCSLATLHVNITFNQ